MGSCETAGDALARGSRQRKCPDVRDDFKCISEDAVIGQQREHRGHRSVTSPAQRTGTARRHRVIAARRHLVVAVTGVFAAISGLAVAMHGAGSAIGRAHGALGGRSLMMIVVLGARRDSMSGTAIPRDERRERGQLADQPDRCPQTHVPPERCHDSHLTLPALTHRSNPLGALVINEPRHGRHAGDTARTRETTTVIRTSPRDSAARHSL